MRKDNQIENQCGQNEKKDSHEKGKVCRRKKMKKKRGEKRGVNGFPFKKNCQMPRQGSRDRHTLRRCKKVLSCTKSL